MVNPSQRLPQPMWFFVEVSYLAEESKRKVPGPMRSIRPPTWGWKYSKLSPSNVGTLSCWGVGWGLHRGLIHSIIKNNLKILTTKMVSLRSSPHAPLHWIPTTKYNLSLFPNQKKNYTSATYTEIS